MLVRDHNPMSYPLLSSIAVEDVVMTFHLASRSEELIDMCVTWRKKVQCIPCAWPVSRWGPSDEVLFRAACDQVQPSFRDEDEQSEQGGKENDNEGLDDNDIGDDELMDAIEDIALADEYRYAEDTRDFDYDLEDIEDGFMPSSPTRPPR
jgi:hypothetical protein